MDVVSTHAGDVTPRNEFKGWRIVAALSVVAVCLSVGGLAFDAYVLVTHQLTGGHRVSDIVALISFGVGAYAGIATYRSAAARIAALRFGADPN